MAWQSPIMEEVLNAGSAQSREAQRTFMARVYGWMFFGLAVTGGVALVSATSLEIMLMVRSIYLVLVLGQLGLVWALSGLGSRLSAGAAGVLFTLYAALNGLIFSYIFLVYSHSVIGSAFLVTAGSFAAMSVYATVTRRDLSAWGSFLMMGLFGVIIASVVQWIWPNDALSFVLSCCCVVLFAGLTAYDTQKLRQLSYVAAYEDGAMGRLAIQGALSLYLDFINLFLAILRLFGRRR